MTRRVAALAGLLASLLPVAGMAAPLVATPAAPDTHALYGCGMSCREKNTQDQHSQTEALNAKSLAAATPRPPAPASAASVPASAPGHNGPTIAAGTGVQAPDAATVPWTEK